MKAIAPGKLILSGEHAVVYQKPALTLAIDRHVQTSITPVDSEYVYFSLLNTQSKIKVEELKPLKAHIDKQYRLFLNEKCSVRDILQNPAQLTQYVIADFLDKNNITPQKGFTVHINSTITPGCGMGSSAAAILSVLLAAQHYFNVPPPADGWLHTGMLIENLQHGHSSGLDIRASLQGNCLYAENELYTAKTPPEMPLHVINTGKATSTTGECVSHVAKHFASSTIWEDFSHTTQAIKTAFTDNNPSLLKMHIQKNHQLLIKIGVVPKHLQNFIGDLEKQGAAAKICGAGAVRGKQAGMLLMVVDDPQKIQSLCAEYNYSLERIQPAKQGARLV